MSASRRSYATPVPVLGHSTAVTITVEPLDVGHRERSARAVQQLRQARPARQRVVRRLLVAGEFFPDAADYDRGQYRACLRPMTPDGPPILGLGRHRNLFLNCGHGHMGWTMACGTARIVADLMLDRMPELDLQGLTVRR